MRVAADAAALGGLTEMLPDEELPVSEGQKPLGHISGMGLNRYKCAVCGKVFEAYSEYGYKLTYKSKTRWYCCHKHMRLHEAPMIEREKQAVLNRWTSKADAMTERARVEAEVYRCRKKLEEWMARTQEPGFKELHWKKRGAINQTVVKWRTKLLMAEERLEEMKSEAGQPV